MRGAVPFRMSRPGGEYVASAPEFAAVDWGTSRLRVWLMARDGAVLGERKADEGLEAAGRAGFGETLENHLAALDAPAALPVVVCGMAGSRQGWVEAPYVDCPADPQGIAGGAVQAPHDLRRVYILPGMANRDRAAPDVMRGEETQLLGMLQLRGPESFTAIMPGTHCKWVSVTRGAVAAFRTWITGELFALLSRHSILRHSIGSDAPPPSPLDDAFLDGVDTMLENPEGVTSRLFSVRAGGLLFADSARATAARLSGLLIGAEIADARTLYGADGTCVLVGGNALSALYEVALRRAGFAAETVDADAVVRAGLLDAARRLPGFGSGRQ
jgi:2-dehydro-3-deoxygalactonokinase